MRIIYKSWIYKLIAVSRYLFLRAYYGSRFRCPELSMVGSNCGIHIFSNGRIICNGRIILDDHVMLYAKGELQIGKRFGINRYSRIVAHEKIEIGNHVTIGQMVSILDHDHQYQFRDGRLQLEG